MSSCSVVYRKYYTDPEQCYREAVQNKPFDAVIVPGFPHETGGWSNMVKERVYWAKHLYERGIAKNIIFSGSAVYTPYVESKVMALYAEQIGIPQEHIFIENKAEHTTENLYYSVLLAESLNFKRLAFASQTPQTSFLKSINKQKFKLPIVYIPIVFDTLNTIPKTDPYIPEEEAFVSNFVSLTEKESALKRMLGTRGNKVKKMMRAQKRQQKARMLNP